MAAPRADEEDLEMALPVPQPQNNVHGSLQPPDSLPPSINPSLNVSRADSDFERGSRRTDDMSDVGLDRETIGARYACPTLGCGTGNSNSNRQTYTNPQYAPSSVPGKRRYPTLDRPPSRAASQSTVHSTNQSTADLVNKKDGSDPPSGALAKFKDFWRNPKYDKLRAIILIVILVIVLLLIIILPISLRSTDEETPVVVPPEYEAVLAPLVVCDGQTLEGYKKDGVAAFKGVPYALPPVNERRWRSPVAISAANCKDLHYPKTMHFGHRCYQSSVVTKDSRESEDCLYLNVWTPSNATGTKLPVVVWIHQGDFKSGSGDDIDQYPLRKVVKEGNFVLVSFNYRLQALGFMALQGLPEANVGLSDQIEALKWVQANIGGFGGDKSMVTVFGLGSGGTSILAMLNSASASGLFSRAWVMSPGTVQDKPVLAAKVDNQPFLGNIGCDVSGDDQALLKCLYGKSAADVLQAVPWYEAKLQWAQPMRFDIPIKDNVTGPYIVADDVVGGVGTFEALNKKSLVNKGVTVVIGSADAESDVRPPFAYFGNGNRPLTLTDPQYNVHVKARLEAFDQEIMAKIKTDYPRLETEQGFTRLVSDIRAICPTNRLADLMHKMGVNVYRYLYDIPPKYSLNAFQYDFWARHSFHGIDMLAFFGALEGPAFGPFFPDAQQFAKDLRATMLKFVRGEVLTPWAPMPKYMYLTKTGPAAALPADDPSYPRNCTHWEQMIPKYSWSN